MHCTDECLVVAVSIEAVRIATVERGGIDDCVRNYEPR